MSTGLDEAFEKLVEDFSQIEEDPNKNVDEQEPTPGANSPPPEDSNWRGFAEAFDIGTLDLDKFAGLLDYHDFKDLDISISPKSLYQRDKDKFIEALKTSSLKASDMSSEEIGDLVESKTNESYGSVYIEADIKKGLSKEKIIRKIRDRYPDIGSEQAEQIYNDIESGKDADWSVKKESKAVDVEEKSVVKERETPSDLIAQSKAFQAKADKLLKRADDLEKEIKKEKERADALAQKKKSEGRSSEEETSKDKLTEGVIKDIVARAAEQARENENEIDFEGLAEIIADADADVMGEVQAGLAKKGITVTEGKTRNKVTKKQPK